MRPKYHYNNVIARSERFTAHANVINNRFEGVSFAPFLKYLIDIVPANMLPVLADEFSLTVYEGWNDAVSVDKKREILKESIDLHRHKGTNYSIKRILKILGFGNVEVLTGLNSITYDGSKNHDGIYFYGDKEKWAFYRVVFLDKPVANTQISMIKKVLESFEAVHMVLLSLNYEGVPLLYNGSGKYDGMYNFGSVAGG